MGWVMSLGRGKANVFAGEGTKDSMRDAIQRLSGDFPERRVYVHTGWREFDGRWVYLHAGGAVGSDGPVAGIETEMQGALSKYHLPAPPDGEELKAAVCASLRMLDGLAPDEIIYPVYASAWRAVLGPCDHSTFLMGRTGVFKSELAALAQRHFGSGMDARHLPSSWSSTGNALEGIAFCAKDSLLVVDDFAPGGSQNEIARCHREADRVFRAQGNNSGRQRMRADATLKEERPPRGLIMATGEDAPRGHSARARLLLVEVSKGDVVLGRLSECQDDAEARLYAQAMAGYLRWLAGTYGDVHGNLARQIAQMRETPVNGQHARTPGIAASLLVGLRVFLNFAVSVEAIDKEQARELFERGRKALLNCAEGQAEHHQDADPAPRFLRLVGALLTSGRAHLEDVGGGRPANAEHLGWRSRTIHTKTGPEDVWQEQGRCIGWLDAEAGTVYLDTEASFAEVQILAQAQGEPIPVTPKTLSKRLRERGLLEGGSGGCNTARKTCAGERRRGLLAVPIASLPLGSGDDDDAVVEHADPETRTVQLPSANRAIIDEDESVESASIFQAGDFRL